MEAESSSRLHSVQFYQTETFFCEAVGRFLHEGLEQGASVVVIATPEHRAALTEYLAARGWNCGQARRQGHLTMLDAADTLAVFMVDGMPDAQLFAGYLGTLLTQIALLNRQHPIQTYGEMVNLLWQRGERRAALQVEELWNDLSRQHSFNLLCGYNNAGINDDAQSLTDICQHHNHVAHEV